VTRRAKRTQSLEEHPCSRYQDIVSSLAQMVDDQNLTATADDQPVNYDRPPVNEVYISIQTKGKVFPDADFGLLLKVFSEAYPKVNVQPRLDRIVEDKTAPIPSLTLELVPGVSQRFWLISQDDTRVIQVQDDRFIHNWRRREMEHGYPRYKSIRQEFESALTRLLAELKVQPTDLVDFCEISYVNHIGIPGVDDVRSHIHRIFTHVDDVDLNLAKLSLEESSFAWTFSVHDERDAFMGRMRIVTSPAFVTSSRKFIFQNQITFRGRPPTPSLDAALRFCDRGHYCIVSAFDQVTTDEMHQLWGRRA